MANNIYLDFSKVDHKKLKRGSIWWCIDKSLMENDKKFFTKETVRTNAKPVLIISNNVLNFNESNQLLQVIPCSTDLDDKFCPSHVEVFVDGTKNTIKCEQIKTISKTRLTFFIDILSEFDIDKLDRALAITLGLELPKKEGKREIVKLDYDKIDEEIATVKRLRTDFENHLIHLEHMLCIDNPVMQMVDREHKRKECGLFKQSNEPNKKIRRSLEEIKQFIEDWENPRCVKDTIAKYYKFNSVQSAYSFYYNWKKKLTAKED